MKNKMVAGAVFASIFVSSAAISDDSFEYHGYFRAGLGVNADGGFKDGGSCYALSHPSNDGLYYRLGNECRDYGEFALVKNGSVNGLNYKGTIMMDLAGNNESSTSTQEWSRRSRQMFLEFDNVFDNGANLWVGRRYYRAAGGFGDVHMIDAFHVNSSGNGFGVTDIPFGEDNKFNFAALQAGTEDVNTIMLDGRADFNIGKAGRLKVALQHLVPFEADGIEATDGSTLSLQWEKKIGIFDQKTVLQLGTDAMGNNPGCWGSDGVGAGNCFDVSPASEGMEGTRIFNNGMFNFSNRFKMNTMAMVEDIDGVRDVKSIGIRPHYSLSKYWSVLGEIGINKVESAGKPAEELNKVTLALQLSPDASNYWIRPALRFYVSKFDWNDAARDGDSGLASSNSDQTDATIFGVQGEIWF